MEEWIIQLMQSMGEWGTVGIFLLMTAENLFPPIPSEVVLTFAGFLTTCSPMSRWQAILFATLGSLAGALILYGLGRALPVENCSGWDLSGRRSKEPSAGFARKDELPCWCAAVCQWCAV